MCGGGLLGLSPKEQTAKAVKMPKVEAPAPPAPSRKQDTGAIIAIGSDNDYDDARRRRLASASGRKAGSTLGTLGSGSSYLL